MAETIFMQEDEVKVTNTRFVVRSQTYTLNGITSVKQDAEPASRGFAIVCGVIGVLAPFVWHISILTIVMAVCFIGVALTLWKTNKDKYYVVLCSASGESLALTSTDSDFIYRVIDALNDAIAARG